MPSSVTIWQRCSAQLHPMGSADSAGVYIAAPAEPRRPAAPPRTLGGLKLEPSSSGTSMA
eukprot:8897499-Pyramimonas_sp.AAC.1